MAAEQGAFLVAGTQSGGGKTTVTLGLLAALQRRGVLVQPFKCGPDFIDPTLHHLACGRLSRNLDARMCGDAYVRRIFSQQAPANGISVVEGVMGLFDGGRGSAAHLAKLLALPVILVIDARSAAESVAAVLFGFENLDPEVHLAGVILNQVGSDRHCELITSAIKQHCRTPVLGALPRRPDLAIPARHLGLHMGAEQPLDRAAQERLAELIEHHCDLERLVTLARQRSAPLSVEHAGRPPIVRPGSVRLAIAEDEAFCFYYRDNLELLAQAGAELLPFSPLRDASLPEDIHGIYLGGGYPELHAAALSANHPLRAALQQWSHSGRPLYAECGGFMYLTEAIADAEQREWPMVGIYPTRARMRDRLSRLGYCHATLSAATFLGPAGTTMQGHEFHYSEITAMGPGPVPVYQLADGRSEGYQLRRTLAGYLHLHWGGTPEVAENFVAACARHAHPATTRS